MAGYLYHSNNYLNQVEPTKEQAGIFLHVLFDALRAESVDILEGNSTIRSIESPVVCWGVPRFSPDAEVWKFVNGQPYAMYASLASVMQAFRDEFAGYSLFHSTPEMEKKLNQHPVPSYNQVMTEVKFIRPTDGIIAKTASIMFRLQARIVNDTEIHMTVGRLVFDMLS